MRSFSVFIVVLVILLGFGEFPCAGVVTPPETGFPFRLIGVPIPNFTDYREDLAMSGDVGHITNTIYRNICFRPQFIHTLSTGREFVWAMPDAFRKVFNPRSLSHVALFTGENGMNYDVSCSTSADIRDIYSVRQHAGIRKEATNAKPWAIGGDESGMGSFPKFKSKPPEIAREECKKSSGDGEPESRVHEPPPVRSLLVAVICFTVGLSFLFWSGKYLYDERNLLSAVLFVCGVLITFAGFLHPLFIGFF